MTRPIHVYEITKSTGGVGEYIRWLAHGLDKKRFRVTIACMSSGGDKLAAALSKIPSVRAFHIPMVRYFVEPFSDSVVLVRLARIFRNEKIDLIHAHVSKPGFLARLAALGTGIPVIYSPHGFSFHAGSGKIGAKIYAGIERFAARYLTAKIIVVADAERALAQRFGVGNLDQFVTVHSGIDLAPFDTPVDPREIKASFQVPENSPLVGAVGRLYDPKQPVTLIEAAALIHASRPDVHFVWVGEGKLKAKALAEIELHGLQSIFHLVGFRDNIPAIMKSLDCFVLPTLWEAFPLTILEAMAASVPIVASNVDGIPEAVLDGGTGFLVSPGDPSALADSILQILSNEQLAKRFSQNGRARVQKLFTRARMLDNIESVYEAVAKKATDSKSMNE